METISKQDMEKIASLGIGQEFITKEQVEEVLAICGSKEERTIERLKACRDEIVGYFGKKSYQARLDGNWAEYDRYFDSMSGATAAIDSELWNMGAAV